MINGISDFEKYKVLRPLIGETEWDSNSFPIINKEEFIESDWCNIKAIGLQNISSKKIYKDCILLMFNYDYRLCSLWNNPLKKVGLFQSFYAVATPDYSVYPQMNINDIRHNVYMSRWLGKTWQNYGCTVYPTIGWALPDTYDIVFGGVEEGSIVVISTLGCQNNKEIFLPGFNEMKKRIKPSLIIVFGDMIDGMTGRFVNFKYIDAFSKKSTQMRLEGLSQVFEYKEVI